MSTHVIREKIHAVREVVCKNKKYSNDEIVLVLQHYELDVDQAIAAFLEDRSGMILTEWHHQGNNKTKAQKRKKQKARRKLRDAEAKAQREKEKQRKEDEEERSSEASSNKENNTPNHNQNGFHQNGVADDDLASETSSVPSSLLDDVTLPSVATLPKQENGNAAPAVVSTPTPPKQPTPTPPPPNGHTPSNDRVSTPPPVTPVNPPPAKPQQPLPPPQQPVLNNLKPVRSRTPSESSSHSTQSSKSSKKSNNKSSSGNLTASTSNNPSSNTNSTSPSSSSSLALSNKKSIEKASRDLQRCTVSFGRYRTLLNDEINDSYKRIKEAFEEITNALMNREVDLIRKMDHVKEEAFVLLSKREQRAKELKKQTDRVGSMTSQEMNELKSEIKHFVSERKFDEELGRTTRFTSDRQQLESLIMNFGEVYPVKNSYTLKSDNTARSRHVSTASIQSVESRPKTPPPTPVTDEPPAVTPAPTKPTNLNLNGSGDAAVKDWAAESADNVLPDKEQMPPPPTTPSRYNNNRGGGGYRGNSRGRYNGNTRGGYRGRGGGGRGGPYRGGPPRNNSSDEVKRPQVTSSNENGVSSPV